MTWLEDLNEPQRRAATHAGGPVLVIAGAGSGKTRTLAARVAWLIEQGTAPDRILLLTFTRRAAAEMLRRAGQMVGPAAAGQVWGGTFHATANRLLRAHGRALGLANDFTVMDQADAADLMNLVRGDLGLDRSKKRFPQKSTLIALYSRVVNSRMKLADVAQKHFPWVQQELEGVRHVFEGYTRRKRERNILDYDDLLLYWNALCGLPGVGEEVADRFEHLLVDEYQDTNLIQAEILQGMRRRNRNLMVVGDDAQSIYSFRAATVRNILDFPEQFAGAEVITLEENYRSTQPILEAANGVMTYARERYTKNLFTRRGGGQRPEIVTCRDEGEQSREVCERVLAKREEGTTLQRQAVLFRAGHHSDHLEVELARRNIPFVKYGGLKFIEAAHVKDLLAILRLMENPQDELSWYRVLQLMEGIGPASARKVIDALLGTTNDERPTTNDQRPTTNATEDPSLVVGRWSLVASEASLPVAPSPLSLLIERPPAVPAAAKAEFDAFRRAIADCLGAARPPTNDQRPTTNDEDDPSLVVGRSSLVASEASLPVASQIERVRRFYEPIFQRTYDYPHLRLRDLDQLQQIAEGYTARGQFLTDLTLDPPSSTQDLAGPPLLDEDYLILSTIHSAKGLEWDVVHVLHVADGMIPSDMATGSDTEIDEERRLLYVAMTRAKNALHLYFPLRYYDRPRGLGDRHGYAQLTRFLPDALLPLFDRSGARADAAADAPSTDTAAGTPQAIDAMLRGLWEG